MPRVIPSKKKKAQNHPLTDGGGEEKIMNKNHLPLKGN